MGCYPIGKIISKAITKCNGGEERRSISPVYNVTYTPPPMYQTRTMAKTVTFSENNSVYIIPNEPVQSPAMPQAHFAQPQPEPARPLPAQPEGQKPRDPKPMKGRVKRHNHESNPHTMNGQPEPGQSHGGPRVVVHGPHPPGFNPPKPVQNHGGPARVIHGPHPPGFNQAEQAQNRGGARIVHGPHPPSSNQDGPVHGPGQPGLNQNEQVQGQNRYGHEYGYGRYAPSPLPRWQATPKRHEYFSGEYRHYPTPVREGIYNIATDPNRLTSIFSEENPNACIIS